MPIKDGTARLEGSRYEWMTANLFSAFSLEAYLNDLGPKRFHCWRDIEYLPVESKLNLLLENLTQSPDFSRRPLGTWKEIFRFRDALAHGRSEQAKESSEQKLLPDESPRYPQVDWEAQCNRQTSVRFREDANAIIKHLQRMGRIGSKVTIFYGTKVERSLSTWRIPNKRPSPRQRRV